MHFLVTIPSGFEKQAMHEIEGKLQKGGIRTTYFKGLLLGKTEIDREEFLELFRKADTDYISKIMPVDEIVQSNIDEMKMFFNSHKTDKRFAVRCIRRGDHSFSSIDVEKEIGKLLKEKGGKVDLKNPEVIFMVNVIQDYSCLSVLFPAEIIVKKPKVERRWEKGKRPISRAELKMREIIEIFPDIFKKDFVALDIGAAPGGWSRAMSEKISKVIAVDNADMSEIRENVVFIRARAENLTLDEKVDLLTNDANILHADSAKLSMLLAERYLNNGGFLIHTVKLGIVPNSGIPAAKSLNQAVDEVRQEFEKNGIMILGIRKLRYNTRNEITIVGRKR